MARRLPDFRCLSVSIGIVFPGELPEYTVRVLLVEDDEIIGDALHDHVVADGWDVDWVKDLKSALSATQARIYAVILLDLRLPDGSGLEVLRRLQCQSRETPVIVLSAYDQVSDQLESRGSGAIDYLVKPFDLSELISRIRMVTTVAAGERPIAAFVPPKQPTSSSARICATSLTLRTQE
jgi:two-component system, OmpR family, response regulator